MAPDNIPLVLHAVAARVLHLAGRLEVVEDLAGVFLSLLGGVGVVEVSLCEA